MRAFKRSGDAELELIARGLLVGLGGMLVASFFLSAEYEKQLWLLVGLCAALGKLAPVGSAIRSDASDLAPAFPAKPLLDASGS